MVFRGRVLAYEDHWLIVDLLHQVDGNLLDYHITADFEVIESWKGVHGRKVRLHAYRCSCGPGMAKLEPGEEMLVMAKIERGKFVATRCSAPIPFDDEFAQRMLAHLGRGDPPPFVGFDDLRFGVYWLPLLALPLGWWYWRRHRPRVAG